MTEPDVKDIAENPAFLTVAQAAAVGQCHENTIRNWIQSGLLRAAKVGATWRISRDEMERVLRQGTTTISTTSIPAAKAAAKGLTQFGIRGDA